MKPCTDWPSFAWIRPANACPSKKASTQASTCTQEQEPQHCQINMHKQKTKTCIYIYNTAYRSSKNLSKIISSQMGSTFIWFEAFPVLPKATEPLSLGVSCKRPSQWHPRARSTMATAVDFYQTRSSLRHHHLPFMFEVFKVWWISSGGSPCCSTSDKLQGSIMVLLFFSVFSPFSP